MQQGFAGGRMHAGGGAVGLGVRELEVGQRGMPPFTGNGVGAAEHLAIDDDAAADAGSQNHAKDRCGAGGGAIGGFGQRQAVGIVGQPDRAIECAFEVLLQRLAVEAGGVGVLDPAGGRGNRAGGADADGAAGAQLGFGLLNQRGDGRNGGGVILLRGGHTAAQDLLPGCHRARSARFWCRRGQCRIVEWEPRCKISGYLNCVGINMAGHSKWANIQHRKGRQDAKRGKVFTKLIKEITVAAKMGGGDVGMNPRLRLAIDKAKAESMPKDNIENAVKRGSGQLDGVNYEEARYEGYGIGGVAVIVDCLTDNKVRTVADVRHAFNKYGGNMGTDGCVAFQFKHCGQIILEPGASEEAVMEVALESGADDIIPNEDGSIEVLTSPDPSTFEAVKEALEKAGFKPAVAEITMRAEAETELAGDDAIQMQKILDALDVLDDVQDVYTNAVLPE